MLSAHVRWRPRPSPQEFKALWMIFFLCVFICAAKNASLLCRGITLDFGRGAMLFKDKNWATVFYHFIQIRRAKLLFQTTSGHDCSACFTEGCGTFLSSTVTHHLSGKLTKQFIVKKKKKIFTVDFIYLKFTELSLITPLFPWNCPPPWARFYSSSTICQEVGRVAYVSSSMSVHGGEKGGWEQAV